MASDTNNPNSAHSPDGVQGEGDYAAGKAYQQETSAAAEDKGAIAAAARKAADALNGPEAAELEQARRDSAAVKPGSPV